MLSLYVCAVYVFAHVCLQLRGDAQEKNHFMAVIWAMPESHVPRDDEFCRGLSPACTMPVYCKPYTHTEMHLETATDQGRLHKQDFMSRSVFH